MLNLLLLILSLLTACAANQSAFPAPRPPSFSPTMDAPITVGQPGHVGPMVLPPRSPHTRVLPQTPETMKAPGIWASDEPLGIVAPEIFGLPMPLPTSAPNDPRLDALARRCASSMDATAREVGVSPIPDGVSVDVRMCLAMHLYNYCLFWTTKGKDADAPTKAKIDALIADMRGRTGAACKGVPRASFEPAYNRVTSTWRPRNVRDDGPPSL
jgi:hypothetical protein